MISITYQLIDSALGYVWREYDRHKTGAPEFRECVDMIADFLGDKEVNMQVVLGRVQSSFRERGVMMR